MPDPYDYYPNAPFNQSDKTDEEEEDDKAQQDDWEDRCKADDALVDQPSAPQQKGDQH